MRPECARSASGVRPECARRAAGGGPGDVGRFTIYVTDMGQYRSNLKPLGEVYRKRMGRHYPAMALLEVRSLVDPNAVVEIEATACL